MAILFGLFGLFLAACGVAIAGSGIDVLVAGDPAGLFGVGCGLPVFYGAYLFGRAAIRVRRDLRARSLTDDERHSRRRKAGFFVVYAASLIASAAALPGAAVPRVVMAIVAILVLPLLLAREFEPPRRR